ncbi:MAG TPA: phosphoenolpyruvate--protein phosphotransferase [Gemmatimonadales bacterium]|nr:phosphoenolpyruvate--protein phosphotransferase [Gemmatimonadales bacterium]
MTSHRVLKGVGVSPGLAVANAVAVRWSLPDVEDRTVSAEEIDHEIDRLHDAVEAVAEQLETLRLRTEERAGPEEARIFDAQIMMVRDVEFLSGVEALIRRNSLAAETAYDFKALELRSAWSRARTSILRDRLADLNAIQLRMLAHLMGQSAEAVWFGDMEDQVILVARDLLPGITVQVDRDRVVGFVSEEGTRTSHAAILAHSLGIPAVMGVTKAMDLIEPGALVLLDGQTGIVIVDPTSEELEVAQVQASRRAKLDMQLEGIVHEPAVTPDGVTVDVMANVDLPEEIVTARRLGADGVGLLRTEFLVTGRTALPTEDEQTEYYRRVGAAFSGRPVVVRSYDLGGDKFPAVFDAPHEANPFLGWRSIRVCLDQPELFRPQLRALLRAAADRNVHLMLPMVISLEELHATRVILAEESARLQAAGVRAATTVPIGVMIETPAAVLLADAFAAEVEFMSVGSNDLTQYTLAVDRGNARLADLFSPLHPAVVRQLATVQRAAAARDIPVSVCGEMASDPMAIVLLLGLGYQRVSVAPPAVPLTKWIIRHVPQAAAAAAAAVALASSTRVEIEVVLRDTLGTYLDLRLVDPAGSLPRVSGRASLPGS